MATDADEVFEDLMSYNVFDLTEIDATTESSLRKAIVKDKGGHISNALLNEIAETNKAEAIAKANTFSKESAEVNQIGRGTEKLLEAQQLERSNTFNVGDEAEYYSSTTFEKARGDLEAKQIGTVRAQQEGRAGALETTREYRRNLFLQESTKSSLEQQNRRTASSFAKFYDVSEEQAINRLKEVGIEVDDTGRIL